MILLLPFKKKTTKHSYLQRITKMEFELQSSVDLEPRDRNRKAPLDLAAKHGHEDIIKFLETGIHKILSIMLLIAI